MKAIILAGGLGTRITEESGTKPKPMIEIGGRPILWHIMKIYSKFGINDFIICVGYKGYVVKEYFAQYLLHRSDVTIDLRNNTTKVHQVNAEPWSVTIVDTGENSMTGGRLKRVAPYIGDEDFLFTYGDGLSDIDIGELIHFHRRHGRLATVTAAQPPGRWGIMSFTGERITSFIEKPANGGYINGGFFVLNPGVMRYIQDDHTVWEREPLERLAQDGEIHAYFHKGFWAAMDTLRDKNYLEELWMRGQAPWKVW